MDSKTPCLTRPGIAAHRDMMRRLDRETDRIMRLCGYYTRSGEWRRVGRITMRTISDRKDKVGEAIRREQARRHFAEVDDLRAEVDRYSEDASARALDELARLIAPDRPMEQEALIRRVELMEAELAAGDEEPVVRLAARAAAISWLESFHVDMVFCRVIGVPGGLSAGVTRDLTRWRVMAGRRLESCLKTLAYVRKIGVTDVERTISRWRIVAA